MKQVRVYTWNYAERQHYSEYLIWGGGEAWKLYLDIW